MYDVYCRVCSLKQWLWQKHVGTASLLPATLLVVRDALNMDLDNMLYKKLKKCLQLTLKLKLK